MIRKLGSDCEKRTVRIDWKGGAQYQRHRTHWRSTMDGMYSLLHVNLGLMPLLSLAGKESSYGRLLALVANSGHEAFTAARIAVSKPTSPEHGLFYPSSRDG